MSVKIIPLDRGQYLRLINVFDIDEEIVECNFVEIEGTVLTKIEIKYKDHEESIYPNREDYDFIRNGLTVTRDEL